MTAAGRGTLPTVGAVLGVDVGFSPTRRSSAVCRLSWDEHGVGWAIRRFRALPEEREATILAVAGAGRLEAAAFDGPLRTGFDVVGRYRLAERLLTRRLGRRIGKPGQANAPVGKSLNAAANDCVGVVLRGCDLAPATHVVRIDDRAVVEAFPSAFLGVMLPDPSVLAAVRANRSDVFYRHLAELGALDGLLARLLPGRRLAGSVLGVTNHDDRAALVCALTSLCVAAGDYVAVGDEDGWIMLPPRGVIADWAWMDLEANACDGTPGCLYRSTA